MPNRNVAGIGLALALLLAAGSCGGSGRTSLDTESSGAYKSDTAQSPQHGVGLNLPAPSELAKMLDTGHGKRASYVEADLSLAGASFSPLLPHNRASVNATSVDLAPDWSSSGSMAFDHLAYATYHFTATGYDRDSRIEYSFSVPPSAAGSVWLGLANWSKDRWDWYHGGAAEAVTPVSLAPYFDFTANLLVVVLRTGTDLSTLANIRLGAHPPVPALSVDVAKGPVPLSVNLDASASSSGEGAITKFEWDYDGDGIYDEDSGTTPTAATVYSVNGVMQATVRVTNSFNITATRTVPVTVIGPWQHTWGNPNPQQFSDVIADSTGDIFAVGYTRDLVLPSNPDLLLLQRYTPTGELLWAKTWTNGMQFAYGSSIDLDSDGNLVIAGSVDGGAVLSNEGLVQKWTSNGTLLWSRSFGGNGYDRVQKAMVDGTDIYVAAQSGSIHPDYDLVTFKLDTMGNVLWARDYNHFDESCADATMCWSFLSGLNSIYVLGEINGGATLLPLVLCYDPSGNLVADQEYLAASDVRPKAIRVTLSALTLERKIYVAAYTGSPANLVLLRSDGAFALDYQKSWGGATDASPERIAFDSAGNLVICGRLDGLSVFNGYGALWRFDAATGSTNSVEFWNDGDNYVTLNSIYPYEGGLLLAGYSADATGSWSATSGSESDLSNSWAPSGGTDVAYALALSVEPGPVADITAEAMDTGAGANDALIMHLAQ